MTSRRRDLIVDQNRVMDLSDLLNETTLSPGTQRLPWDDGLFSARMLAEHLDASHDLASRRPSTIDTHVAWLTNLCRGEHPSVLDLGCGPGLYCERLAAAGFSCVGVDIGPAAIAYASERARGAALECEYVLGDFTTVELGRGFDLVLNVFGEISTFHIDDVRRLLVNIAGVLNQDGCLVIERSTLAGVRSIGEQSSHWYRTDRGLFGDRPHLVLHESRWFESAAAAVERWWVLEDGAAGVQRFETTTWWHGAAFDDAVADAGLVVEQRFGDLAGADHDVGAAFEVLLLRAV